MEKAWVDATQMMRELTEVRCLWEPQLGRSDHQGTHGNIQNYVSLQNILLVWTTSMLKRRLNWILVVHGPVEANWGGVAEGTIGMIHSLKKIRSETNL